MTRTTLIGLIAALLVLGGGWYLVRQYTPTPDSNSTSGASDVMVPTEDTSSEVQDEQEIIGFWECLPPKDRTGPQTMECAFGIAVDRSDGHFGIDTSLMAQYPIDFPTGTKVRVRGIVTPANQLSSVQKYDIDGIIRATVIEQL